MLRMTVGGVGVFYGGGGVRGAYHKMEIFVGSRTAHG